MTTEQIAIYVEELLNYANSIKAERQNEVTQGQLIGIAEALTILRESCDENLREAIGLEADPDDLLFT